MSRPSIPGPSGRGRTRPSRASRTARPSRNAAPGSRISGSASRTPAARDSQRRSGPAPWGARVTAPLWSLTATDLAAAIRTRQVSAREAVASTLARIAEVNPRLNALVRVPEAEALRAAEDADRAVAAGTPL